MKKDKLFFSAMLFGLLASALMLTGCATTIRVAVERPPTLNTAGIKRIAIMPFESNDRSHREIAQYATEVTIRRIQEMNYFTLVDSSEIERLRRIYQSIDNYVDALFTGRVTRIEAANDAVQGDYRNRDGTVIYYTTYTTDVEIELNYSLVLARDLSLIGPVFKQGRSSLSSQEAYPSALELLRTAVDNELRFLGRDLAPHTVTENRTFASDKSRNKALQAEMKNALANVKAGNNRAALEAYLGIYERYKSIAAAENASILHEAFGDTQIAANLMQRVFYETGSPRASEVLTRLNRILQDQATLAREYDDNLNQTARVAAFASGEIQKVLPGNARVLIYNNSPAVSMTNAVVDTISADFIRKGIGIVDRENRRIIEAELEYSMSGFVSDEDILSVGNAAGANTIVVIGITGTGAMRRLQVRVLDIERGIQIMQSDTSEMWQL